MYGHWPRCGLTSCEVWGKDYATAGRPSVSCGGSSGFGDGLDGEERKTGSELSRVRLCDSVHDESKWYPWAGSLD